MDELVTQVTTSSTQQGEGITQVSTAVASMNTVTQQNAASAEESSAAAQELSRQAAVLKSAVEELTALIDGGNEVAGHTTNVAVNETVRKTTSTFKAAGHTSARLLPRK